MVESRGIYSQWKVRELSDNPEKFFNAKFSLIILFSVFTPYHAWQPLLGTSKYVCFHLYFLQQL